MTSVRPTLGPRDRRASRCSSATSTGWPCHPSSDPQSHPESVLMTVSRRARRAILVVSNSLLRPVQSVGTSTQSSVVRPETTQSTVVRPEVSCNGNVSRHSFSLSRTGHRLRRKGYLRRLVLTCYKPTGLSKKTSTEQFPLACIGTGVKTREVLFTSVIIV